MRIEHQPCYILHQRPYRETSLLLEVLSLEHGRISLLAKGVKRKKSRYTGLIQLYQKLKLGWQGHGELKTMIHAESEGLNKNLKGNNLIAAFYLNELIIRLLHRHESHTDLFYTYEKAILDLSEGEKDIQVILRLFEKKLLESLGYGLILDHVVQSQSLIDKAGKYYYQAESGPHLSRPDNSDYIEISGQTLIDINNDIIESENCMREAKMLMRYVLTRQLDGKPMLSRDLYKAYIQTISG